ncbi:MAG: hypothetical protein JWO19_90 [Bryobacterales bacterium]|nr:hypothetical protein [Bryobacterales bacterium]
MKTLTSLLVGGALMLGTAMAQDAPKSATPAGPAAQNQTTPKVKKHRKHKKDKTAKPAVTPSNAVPKK